LSDFAPPEPGAPRPPIEVRLDCAGTSAYTAEIHLCGEHDLATAVDIQHALESISGDVLIDMADWQFIDSTVINVLLGEHPTRQRQGATRGCLAASRRGP
jgi:anti-anti-sigma regulatory factor